MDPTVTGVSVVVTIRNEGERLRTLLAAIDLQTFPAERYELIVVDDASQDDTLDIARSHRTARVIPVRVHAGLPSGRNVGIRAATGDVIAFTDGDCIPNPDWLERGVARLEATGADILAGGILMPLDNLPRLRRWSTHPSFSTSPSTRRWASAQARISGYAVTFSNVSDCSTSM